MPLPLKYHTCHISILSHHHHSSFYTQSAPGTHPRPPITSHKTMGKIKIYCGKNDLAVAPCRDPISNMVFCLCNYSHIVQGLFSHMLSTIPANLSISVAAVRFWTSVRTRTWQNRTEVLVLVLAFAWTEPKVQFKVRGFLDFTEPVLNRFEPELIGWIVRNNIC